MSEIKLDETPTLTFEPFIEEMQPPAREQKKQVTETAQAFDDSIIKVKCDHGNLLVSFSDITISLGILTGTVFISTRSRLL